MSVGWRHSTLMRCGEPQMAGGLAPIAGEDECRQGIWAGASATGSRARAGRARWLPGQSALGTWRRTILHGEAGVGKSALLEYAVGAAHELRLARTMEMESEMELAFASVHLLCGPLLERLDNLPTPQRDALGIAFGLLEGFAPDRFLVALAVLNLLANAAEERPLLCVIDDAQWLDQASAQVLAFAARRLLAEPIGLIFAARGPDEQFRGLTDLEVRGLPDHDARTLLHSAVRFPLDEQIKNQILAEMNGNPLALLELPRGLSPAEPSTNRAGFPAAAGDTSRGHEVADAGRGS